MSRLDLFKIAAQKCCELYIQYPECSALASITKQIDYLIDLESGSITDRSFLKDIIIGVLAAREIETRDSAVAELLYQVDTEARRMTLGSKD